MNCEACGETCKASQPMNGRDAVQCVSDLFPEKLGTRWNACLPFGGLMPLRLGFWMLLAATQGFGQEARLRFSPEVGRTYRYSYSVNLDKTTFGQTNNERIEALLLMRILGKDKESYQTRWEIVPGRNNLQTEVMDRIKEQVSQVRAYAVSEQYVFDPEDGQSLFLPREPVQVGSAWEGRPPLSFADLTTSKPPRLRQEYRLVRVETNSAGRFAQIEGTPLEKSLRVPLEAGQLGIRCGEKGAIVQLRKGTQAEARLHVGDSIVAINGRACPTPSSRNLLAERYIEPLHNVGSNVTLTIRRGSTRVEVEIPKILGTLGHCQVDVVELRKKVQFHLDKGIVLSDLTTAQFSLQYHLQEGSFVDDYQGSADLERMAKSKLPPRLYKYEWRLALADEKAAGAP